MIFPPPAIVTPESLEQQFMEYASLGEKSARHKEIHLQRRISSQYIKIPLRETPETLSKINEIINGIACCLDHTNCLREAPALSKLIDLSKKIKQSLPVIFGKPVDEARKEEFAETKSKINNTLKHLKLCKKEGNKLLQKHPDYFKRCPAQLMDENHLLNEPFRTFVKETHVPHIGKSNLPHLLESFYNRLFIQSLKMKSEKKKEPLNTLEIFQNAIEKNPIGNFNKIDEFTSLNNELAEMWNRFLLSGVGIDAFLPTPPSSLKKSKEETSGEIWNNRAFLFKAMLDNLPDLKLDTTAKMKMQIRSSLYNNYGLKLEGTPKIEPDNTLSFQAGTVRYRTPTRKGAIRTASQLNLLYKPETQQLFPSEGAMTMCDAIALPDITNETPLVATLCDGCGWGEASKHAAETAAVASMSYTNGRLANYLSLRQISKIKLKAIMEAHNAILKENLDAKSCGTTTILHLSLIDSYLIATSLGDCKLFIIRYPNDPEARTCIDLTAHSRLGSVDASDPGGKLGPQFPFNGELIPQINNLSVHAAYLNPGDIVIAASDGLGDLLDPQLLNEPPTLFGLKEPAWDNTLPSHLEMRKKIAEEKMLGIIDGIDDIEEISRAIDAYAAGKVEKYLVNLICSPGKSKFTMSREEFPGKPDHKAHIVIKLAP